MTLGLNNRSSGPEVSTHTHTHTHTNCATVVLCAVGLSNHRICGCSVEQYWEENKSPKNWRTGPTESTVVVLQVWLQVVVLTFEGFADVGCVWKCFALLPLIGCRTRLPIDFWQYSSRVSQYYSTRVELVVGLLSQLKRTI